MLKNMENVFKTCLGCFKSSNCFKSLQSAKFEKFEKFKKLKDGNGENQETLYKCNANGFYKEKGRKTFFKKFDKVWKGLKRFEKSNFRESFNTVFL